MFFIKIGLLFFSLTVLAENFSTPPVMMPPAFGKTCSLLEAKKYAEFVVEKWEEPYKTMYSNGQGWRHYGGGVPEPIFFNGSYVEFFLGEPSNLRSYSFVCSGDSASVSWYIAVSAERREGCESSSPIVSLVDGKFSCILSERILVYDLCWDEKMRWMQEQEVQLAERNEYFFYEQKGIPTLPHYLATLDLSANSKFYTGSCTVPLKLTHIDLVSGHSSLPAPVVTTRVILLPTTRDQLNASELYRRLGLKKFDGRSIIPKSSYTLVFKDDLVSKYEAQGVSVKDVGYGNPVLRTKTISLAGTPFVLYEPETKVKADANLQEFRNEGYWFMKLGEGKTSRLLNATSTLNSLQIHTRTIDYLRTLVAPVL